MATKYHNRKIKVNGETFDSQREYERFCELNLLQKAGVIQNLQRQTKFVLIPSQYATDPKTGNKKCVERSVVYVADFQYVRNGKIVVEDTKGFKTKEYIIKRKLMMYVHGIQIVEVR